MPPEMKTVRGIFVPFTEEEEAELMVEFRDAGYEWNGQGIRKFLIDMMNESEPELTPAQEFAEVLSAALKKNPRAPLTAAEMGLRMATSLRDYFNKGK